MFAGLGYVVLLSKGNCSRVVSRLTYHAGHSIAGFVNRIKHKDP